MRSGARIVEVRQNVLKQNDLLARELRQRFDDAGLTVISMVSTPGAGKTALLEHTLTRMRNDGLKVAALVGDLAPRFGSDEVVDTIAELRRVRAIADVADRRPMPKILPLKPVPLQTLVVNVTNQCNLACTYCYEYGEDKIVDTENGKQPKFMSEATAREAVEFALRESRDNPHAHITFFGGETLMNFNVLKSTIAYARQRAAEVGKDIDFKQGYWTPPLSAREVYESEKAQIENVLGLRALVSLTEHDDIEASALAPSAETSDIPVSLEWTVPFGEKAFFHVGVHNVPRQNATRIANDLGEYTKAPKPGRLAQLLEMLGEFPETLIVLNHPMWDIEFAGQKRHEATLSTLLETHGERFHALEVNGYRRWRENRRVIQLAESAGLPIVSGGDRHGRDANAILNLTRADTLANFISEVRVGKGGSPMPWVHPPTRCTRRGSSTSRPSGRRSWRTRVSAA